MALTFYYQTYVRRFIPSKLRRFMLRYKRKVLMIYGKWRVRHFPTKILGKQYTRSRDLIVLTLTYDCNLQCYNCDQSVTQAPSKESMSIDQVKDFLKESIDKNHNWKRIRLSGGEPTRHPKFLDIIQLLLNYRDNYSPSMVIEVNTNGSSRPVKKILAKIPDEVRINNTAKAELNNPKTPDYFKTFNEAPIDQKQHTQVDYSNGCGTQQKCGIGLNKYGYYPCVVAAGIDRIYQMDLGRKALPSSDDDMLDELDLFCSLCGHFNRMNQPAPVGPVISPTWEEAYLNWKTRDKVMKPIFENNLTQK